MFRWDGLIIMAPREYEAMRAIRDGCATPTPRFARQLWEFGIVDVRGQVREGVKLGIAPEKGV